ncbi:MAG: hypothetical protein NTW32_15480 [Chloroflexi bacterium]|nr:hypothetical protein [Chloroflexota bacterium]
MTTKIRSFGVFITIVLLTFLSISSSSPAFLSQPAATPVPKARATAMALEAQAGHSDGILFLGILIFIFIVVPIFIKYMDLRSSR